MQEINNNDWTFDSQSLEKKINEELVTESQITEIKAETKKSWFQEFIEFIRDIVWILIIVFIIRTFLAAPFQISWSSMETSYHDKEFIIVNKLSYTWLFWKYIWDPSRWDVVIFRPHAQNWKEYYIKRVVWAPWDTIKFQDGDVYIKLKDSKKWFIKLNEDYLSEVSKWKTFLPFDVKESEFIIPDWEYFLIWDNRNNSSDSRSCFQSCSLPNSTHFIKRSDIIWRVFINFWYFNIFKTNIFWKIEWIWELKWVSKPRFLDTPYTWDYNELK